MQGGRVEFTSRVARRDLGILWLARSSHRLLGADRAARSTLW